MKKNHMDHDYKATPFGKKYMYKKIENFDGFLFWYQQRNKNPVHYHTGTWGTLFFTWISNYIHYKEWDEIIYPFKLQWYSH